MHPYLQHPGPIPFAHRGGLGDFPENTLPAFEASVELGYRYIETDAHVTKDGVVIAFHDPRMDRTTDVEGAFEDLTIAEVEAADAGARWTNGDGTFPFKGQGLTVPRMETLLERWPDLKLNIDPKSDQVVDPLIDLIERLDAWDRTCFGAFSDKRLTRIRERSRGRACTSMGPRAVTRARIESATGRMSRQDADCLQVPVKHGPMPIVTKRFVEAAHKAGLFVHVWTVNEEQEMHDLLDLGVDGLITDRPRLLKDVFAARGLTF